MSPISNAPQDLETGHDYRVILGNGDSVYINATSIQYEQDALGLRVLVARRGQRVVAELYGTYGWYQDVDFIPKPAQTARVSAGVERFNVPHG